MSASYGPPADLLRALNDAGAGISDSRKIDHGTQHLIVRGPEKVNLNLYDSGKALVQGKESALKGVLDAWKRERTPSSSKKSSTGDSRKNGGQKSSSGGQRTPVVSRVSRVGTDEAGKGDYFGPLVVAGVRVRDEASEAALRGIGVRDSKLLGTGQAVSMAGRIPEALGPDNVYVVSLEPPEFERRRSKAGDNVNRLLGEINVEILSKLSGGVDGFVVDEFAKKARSYIEPSVPSGVELEVRPRAEDDAAVAAASIMARARYLEEMDELSRWAGFTLPRGSTHVKGAAHRMYSERGRQGLEQVAKVSFSITTSIGAV
ncbi:ribonuclease HIII [soil metagenome]